MTSRSNQFAAGCFAAIDGNDGARRIDRRRDAQEAARGAGGPHVVHGRSGRAAPRSSVAKSDSSRARRSGHQPVGEPRQRGRSTSATQLAGRGSRTRCRGHAERLGHGLRSAASSRPPHDHVRGRVDQRQQRRRQIEGRDDGQRPPPRWSSPCPRSKRLRDRARAGRRVRAAARARGARPGRRTRRTAPPARRGTRRSPSRADRRSPPSGSSSR